MSSTPPRPQFAPHDDRAVFQPYAPPASYQGAAPFPNPYAQVQAPPVVMPGLPGAHVSLFNPNLVGLATFLGSALGGAVILAINDHRLGRRHAAVVTVILGALASAITVGIGFAMPEGIPSAPIGIVPILIMRVIAQKRQGALVSAHIAAGGKQGSGWAVAGIGLASLAAVLIPAFVIAVIVAVITEP